MDTDYTTSMVIKEDWAGVVAQNSELKTMHLLWFRAQEMYSFYSTIREDTYLKINLLF